MKSQKAKQFIMDHAEKDGDTCQYYVHDGEALESISIAEKEITKRATEVHRLLCQHHKPECVCPLSGLMCDSDCEYMKGFIKRMEE